jgi:hypothetical protein
MNLIDVKYVRAEKLTDAEKRELGIDPRIKNGLIAIETTNPGIKRTGVLVQSYCEYLMR